MGYVELSTLPRGVCLLTKDLLGMAIPLPKQSFSHTFSVTHTLLLLGQHLRESFSYTLTFAFLFFLAPFGPRRRVVPLEKILIMGFYFYLMGIASSGDCDLFVVKHGIQTP
jgi:hypothetical protein